MAKLTVKDMTKEAKGSFGFKRYANKHYSDKVRTDNEAKEQETPGIASIYQKLLNYDYDGLVAFWMCVFNSQTEVVTNEDIESALEARIEQDGDSQPLFAEALEVLDDSGFFKRNTAKFWQNIEMASTMAQTEEERATTRQYLDVLKKSHAEIRSEKMKKTK